MTDFYTAGGNPSTGSGVISANVRTEFTNIATAFTKVAPYTGNGDKVVVINSGGTAQDVVSTTGSGNVVRATSPTLVTPILGTPTSVTLTNATGLPISTGVSGLGTGIATALAVNTGSAGAPVLFNGNAGTPSALVGTNITGTASGLSIGGNAATSTTATTATSATTATTATNATNVTGTISSGVTGTTQTANDNSTKIATTAYADDSANTAAIAGKLKQHTAVTLSGTSTELTATIRASANRIIIAIEALQTNGASPPIIQLSDSGGYETTGYVGYTDTNSGASGTTYSISGGFALSGGWGSTVTLHSTVILTRISGNKWAFQTVGSSELPAVFHGNGTKTLSAELTSIRVTTVGGVNTFTGSAVVQDEL